MRYQNSTIWNSMSQPTHKQGNTIDWVISIKNLEEFLDLHTSEFLPDHYMSEWLYIIKRPNTVKTRSVVRNLKKSNREEFARDLNLEINKNIHDRQSLQELYDGFISSIKTTLDMHAPKRECSKTVRSNHPWFDHDAKRLKLQWRLVEKCWLKSGNTADRTHYMHKDKCYLRHLCQSKKSYINS